MRVETELMRGAGPLATLKMLERGEMYGYELVEALAARTEGVLDMGQSTLYPLLYNLEAKGLIKSRWEEREAGASAGRPRKYYGLTGKGRTRLAKDEKQWAALICAMRAIGVNARAMLVPAPARSGPASPWTGGLPTSPWAWLGVRVTRGTETVS